MRHEWPLVSTAMFVAIWCMAIAGVIFKYFLVGKHVRLSLALYIAMGWMGAFAMKILRSVMHHRAVMCLLVGGFAYTFGVIFYAVKRIPFGHAIWHSMCMLGTLAHFWGVLHYVIPLTTPVVLTTGGL
mmetsp:Transcript_44719/g.72795  ORF Transcript_44719/g.72795 Transcript_44719/m.72795 type:complete len:128 (+) Transcript_44719:417-800(+)